MYKDRLNAGEVLLDNIIQRGFAMGLSFVFGIPRGGIEVAYPIAEGLHEAIIPLIVHKIPSSMSSEVAIGAITHNGEFILSEYAREEPESYLQEIIMELTGKLAEREKYFGSSFNLEDVFDKEVLIVDDGIATGETVLLSVKVLLKFSPKKVYVAVPVSSFEGYKLVAEFAEVVCPVVDRNFYAVGTYYEEFEQLADEQAKQYIEKSKKFEKI